MVFVDSSVWIDYINKTSTPQNQNIDNMRTNIEIDDKLIRETQKITGIKTKREVVAQALETFLRLKRQEKLAKNLRGKVRWEGDLEQMRLD